MLTLKKKAFILKGDSWLFNGVALWVAKKKQQMFAWMEGKVVEGQTRLAVWNSELF